jgi:hypothetical protein
MRLVQTVRVEGWAGVRAFGAIRSGLGGGIKAHFEVRRAMDVFCVCGAYENGSNLFLLPLLAA